MTRDDFEVLVSALVAASAYEQQEYTVCQGQDGDIAPDWERARTHLIKTRAAVLAAFDEAKTEARIGALTETMRLADAGLSAPTDEAAKAAGVIWRKIRGLIDEAKAGQS